MRKIKLVTIVCLVYLLSVFSGTASTKASVLEDIFKPFEHLQYLYDLMRCVEAEATDGTYDQKINVATCIMNRVDSKEWPNDIHSVIFQKRQFAVISDKRFWSVDPFNEDTFKSCLRVIFGERSHRCEFFCTPKASKTSNFFISKEYDYVFNDYMHDYYR